MAVNSQMAGGAFIGYGVVDLKCDYGVACLHCLFAAAKYSLDRSVPGLLMIPLSLPRLFSGARSTVGS